MARPSNREKVLDAFEALVVRGGMSGVTLDAVAELAGVSKGGLLYHFPSKDALVEGFGQRLSDRVDELIADAPTDPAEVVRWYLAYEIQGASERRTFNSLLAALHANESDTTGFVTAVLDRLYEPLGVVDPYVAELVRLVGDGMYLSALLGLRSTPDDVRERIVDALARRADPADG